MNTTSAVDAGHFLESVLAGTNVSAEYSAQMLSLLKNQTRRSKIPSGVPSGIVTANKTGELNTVQNDAAIIFAPTGTYVLTVMTDGGSIHNIGKLSSIIYNSMKTVNGWTKTDGVWNYYRDGTMVTGWCFIGKHWYYFDDSGAMKTGWLSWSGGWYYFTGNGAMKTDWSYWNGGWIRWNNSWYYLNADGTMQTGWLSWHGSWYYLNADGTMKTGWLSDGSSWYYLSSSGAMRTGWLYWNSSWYYLDSDGSMVTDWQEIGNSRFYFSSDGAMVSGWLDQNSTRYYLDYDSGLVTGWLQLEDAQYYLDPDNGGSMVTGRFESGGYIYQFSEDGVLTETIESTAPQADLDTMFGADPADSPIPETIDQSGAD